MRTVPSMSRETEACPRAAGAEVAGGCIVVVRWLPEYGSTTVPGHGRNGIYSNLTV